MNQDVFRQRWKQTQAIDWQRFQSGGPVGVFSYPGHKPAEQAGATIANLCGQNLCLDVGCGLVKRPAYLPNSLQCFGVDPHQGKLRDFPFAQAIAEALPFPDSSFYAVLFMSVLDHVYSTKHTLAEAHRVVRPGGFLIVWFDEHPEDGHHLRGLTKADVGSMAIRAGFRHEQWQSLPGSHPHPPSWLMTAKRPNV